MMPFANARSPNFAGVVVQTVKIFEDMSGTSDGTQSGTLSNVTQGNTIAVFFGNKPASSGACACSDAQGSYAQDFDSFAATNAARVVAFHLAGANAGGHTISITNTKTFNVAWAVEITAASSASFDTGAAAHSGFNTNTDGISTGNFTTAQEHELILAFCMCGVLPTHGTAYTTQGTSTGAGQFGSIVESKVADTVSAYAGLFTAGSVAAAVVACAFKHP